MKIAQTIVLVATLLLLSCDSKKVAYDTSPKKTESLWAPEGAKLDGLPSSDAAIQPPDFLQSAPAGLVEIYLENDFLVVVDSSKKTRHGPLDLTKINGLSFWRKNRSKLFVPLRQELSSRLAPSFAALRQKKILPQVLISLPSETPASIATCLVWACGPIERINLGFITTPVAGDPAPFRIFPYMSSNILDLGRDETLPVALLLLHVNNPKVSIKRRAIPFTYDPPNPISPELENHLKKYLESCKASGQKPRAGVSIMDTLSPDPEPEFKEMIRGLSFFRKLGITECSVIPSPWYTPSLDTYEEPKKKVKRVIQGLPVAPKRR